MTVKLLVGDVRDRIREIPDGSVDLVACSPPFLALRKYGDNAAEMGSERTPADFLDALLELTQEFGRVLAPHGSIAIELGDTYSGSGGAGGDYNEGGLRDGQAKFRQGYVRNDRPNRPPQESPKSHKWDRSSGRTAPGGQPYADTFKGGGPGGVGWPLPKSLTLIPTLYPASLAYGWNMLNPIHTFDRWRVRNVIVWARPNPPVGQLADKVRPATSYITVACTSARRYFDLDSCRSAGTASAAVTSVPDAHEVPTALLAGTTLAARGWCNAGRSQVSISSAVTWKTQRLEIIEPVGFLVGVETVEGPQMMDLKAGGRTAGAALVPITVERILAGSYPVPTAIGGASTVPTGVVLASDIDAPPTPRTLESAEVVSQRLALVAGQWLAAEITLKLNGANATAFAIAPLLHSEQSRSKHTETAGAPPLDWWEDDDPTGHATLVLPTQPYPGAHYATWPEALASRLIKMMCPLRVCTTCGEPSRRIVETTNSVGHAVGRTAWTRDSVTTALHHSGTITMDANHPSVPDRAERRTLGWTECDCRCERCDACVPPITGGPWPCVGKWRPGMVLDPFAGSGTTLAVAQGLARDATGIELYEANAELVRQRVGMFLDVA